MAAPGWGRDTVCRRDWLPWLPRGMAAVKLSANCMCSCARRVLLLISLSGVPGRVEVPAGAVESMLLQAGRWPSWVTSG